MAIFGNGIFGQSKLPTKDIGFGANITNKILFGEPDQVDTAGPRPDYPLYDTMLDPNGNLKSQYRLAGGEDVKFASNLAELNSKLGGINLDKRALEALRARGLSKPGESDWEKLMLDRQALEETGMRDRTAAAGASSDAEARSALARTGGLSSGARERLARSGAETYAKSLQDIAREGAKSRFDIGIKGEDQRLDVLKSLPGMEVQALEPEFKKTSMWQSLADSESQRKQGLDLANREHLTDVTKFNISNMMNEKARGDASNLAAYQEQMRAYAAAKQADAMANSQKSSGGGKK